MLFWLDLLMILLILNSDSPKLSLLILSKFNFFLTLVPKKFSFSLTFSFLLSAVKIKTGFKLVNE